jgi:hypothetical protein
MNQSNIKILIKGIFLLVLAISGNFIAETLGCKTQKLLQNSMVAKHGVILFMIYFALGVVSDGPSMPVVNMSSSLLIWFLFILFTKMSLFFTGLVFSLLTIIYIMGDYIDYYMLEEKYNKNIINNLQKIRNFLVQLSIGLIIIGFSLYFMKQYSEHSKNWSTITFILGTTKCGSL